MLMTVEIIKTDTKKYILEHVDQIYKTETEIYIITKEIRINNIHNRITKYFKLYEISYIKIEDEFNYALENDKEDTE